MQIAQSSPKKKKKRVEIGRKLRNKDSESLGARLDSNYCNVCFFVRWFFFFFWLSPYLLTFLW